MNRIEDYYKMGPYANFVRQFRTAGTDPISILKLNQPAGEFPDPPTPAFNLFLLTKGIVQTRIDLGAGWFTRIQRPGSFVIAPPNRACKYEVDGPHELLVVSMPCEFVNRLVNELSPASRRDFGMLHADSFRHPFVEQLCFQLFVEATDSSPGGDQFVDHGAALLIHVLSKLAKQPTSSKQQRRGACMSGAALRRVLVHIDAHLADHISLESLAQISGMSKFHFARQFQEAMGDAPYQYVIQQRIESAKRLIVQGEQSFAQIAASLGFTDQSHLGKAFRQRIGVTLLQYAQLHRD